MKHFFTILFCVSLAINAKAQTFAQKQIMAQAVFSNIVNAYGNAKPAPLLTILPNTQKERVVAAYITTPSPTIKLDEQLIDICLQLKADSLNALAIIISHELAHYYNDHNFCSDYAFALGETSLSKALRRSTKANKLEKETEADYQGIWYATIAGYYPYNIFNAFIDKIYSNYNLPSVINGYPTKADRKAINKERLQKCNKLIPIFYAGNLLTKVGEYEAAAFCYTEVLRYFTSRENYNNAGVATLLNALQLKPLQAIEFIYPIEIDAISRLQNTTSRSNSDAQTLKMDTLLLQAKKYFEKSISLDATYIKAYINLACVLDIMDNPEAAIGRLNEIPVAAQNNNTVNMLKGIAYYHADNIKKATLCFNTLTSAFDSVVIYNYKLFALIDKPMQSIEEFKVKWRKRENLKNTNKTYKVSNNENCDEITINNKIRICFSYKLNKVLKIIYDGKEIY